MGFGVLYAVHKKGPGRIYSRKKKKRRKRKYSKPGTLPPKKRKTSLRVEKGHGHCGSGAQLPQALSTQDYKGLNPGKSYILKGNAPGRRGTAKGGAITPRGN